MEDRILSQEGAPGTHETPNQISKELGISRASVFRIVRKDLNLHAYKRINGQKLTEINRQTRVTCANAMLRRFTRDRIKKIFFTDEKIFRVDAPQNSQNDRVYNSAAGKKTDIEEERLFRERNHFSPGIMVSVAVGELGKSSLIFVDPEAKVTAEYYREKVLQVMLPELSRLSGGDYTFQQDGARAHTARDTIAYLREHVPDLLEPSQWPANSPDLNPVDYSIWGAMEQRVYTGRKIATLVELRQVLVEEWTNFPQEIISNAIQQFRPRLRKVVEENGGHIEQFF